MIGLPNFDSVDGLERGENRHPSRSTRATPSKLSRSVGSTDSNSRKGDPDMNCVNLRERFGRRYRSSTKNRTTPSMASRRIEDPWLQIIPCRAGTSTLGPLDAGRINQWQRTDCPEAGRAPRRDSLQDGSDA